MDAIIIGDQRQCACIVSDCYAVFLGDLGMGFNEAWATAPGFNRQTTPEFEFSVDFICLPSVYRNKADAFLLHPPHRILATRDQQFTKVGIGPVFRNATHVVEEFVLGVSAEIGIGNFFI